MAAATAGITGGSLYKLSTECIPRHDAQVNAISVIDNDTFVSGSSDRMVTVWARVRGREFAAVHTCPEHQHQLRALTTIQPCDAFPTGGFATGCLDKLIRLYSWDAATRKVAMVRTLTGHQAGVISFSWTLDGKLISGGWDGHARIWDITTGACLHVLEGHENGVSVLGLATGDIATGSTGRKNEMDQHVDYKVRLWSYSALPKPAYGVRKIISDHAHAVRALAAMPDGSRFISCSNDGTVKVRDAATGATTTTFATPDMPDGTANFIYNTAVTGSGLILACCDDQRLRVFSPEAGAQVDEVPLPGTPWAAASLPNGDIVVGCSQAAKTFGHVYVLSEAADRAATANELATYQKDLIPPPKPKGGAAGGAGGGAGGGGDGYKVRGIYEARAAHPGTADGEYGFFTKDGKTFVCSWSAAARAWTDVGEMMGEGEGEGAGGDGVMLDAGGGGTAANGAEYDYVCAVTLESGSGGMKSMQLCFNEEDDAISVARAFIHANGISQDNYEEVRNFVLAEKMKKGDAVRRRKAARLNADATGSAYIPSRTYIESAATDLKKAWAKLLELNAAVGPAAMSKPEEEAVKAVVDVLEQTSRYHSSTVPRPGVKVLMTKLLTWPPAQAFPALDIARVCVTHPDGAAAMVDASSEGVVSQVAAVVKAAGSGAEGRPAALLTGRLLFNCFRHDATRKAVMSKAEDALNVVADLLAHEHATVRYTACVSLHNYAHAVLTATRAAAASPTAAAAAAAAGTDAERVQQALALIVEGLERVEDADGRLKLLVALGTLVLVQPALYGKAAKDMELPAAVKRVADGAASGGAGGAASEAATSAKAAAADVLALLAKA